MPLRLPYLYLGVKLNFTAPFGRYFLKGFKNADFDFTYVFTFKRFLCDFGAFVLCGQVYFCRSGSFFKMSEAEVLSLTGLSLEKYSSLMALSGCLCGFLFVLGIFLAISKIK